MFTVYKKARLTKQTSTVHKGHFALSETINYACGATIPAQAGQNDDWVLKN